MPGWLADLGRRARWHARELAHAARWRLGAGWERLAAGVGARRPRVLILIDYHDRAFDNSAQAIARELGRRYRFDLRYVEDGPRIEPADYDLFYIYFWGETCYHRLAIPPERIVKEVSSHRWEEPPYGPLAPRAMARRYLRDAAVVATSSERLHRMFAPHHPHVRAVRNGFDPAQFHPTAARAAEGPVRFGWAGNPKDEVKGLDDFLRPATRGWVEIAERPGGLGYQGMNEFYNSIDVFVVGSRHEGEPRTLIEAMAAGCFPLATDVGIVPELVRDGDNGIILRERTPEALRDAIRWCQQHPAEVRGAGRRNADELRACRPWPVVAMDFARVFDEALGEACRPHFRNDDVSADTPLERFRDFCELFWRSGHTQLHAVTLVGRTTAVHRHDGGEVEYPGEASLARLPNARIRALSAGWELESRPDLLAFLRKGPDEIALHGLYHVDFSRMTAAEQRADLVAGLERLDRLFPDKLVRYFVPPFNRTSEATVPVARELGLHVLATEGVHLEAEIARLRLVPGVWYRYHHHRFYPETAFTYHPLSLEALAAALARNPRGSAIPASCVASAPSVAGPGR